jgi:hypothetical protein
VSSLVFPTAQTRTATYRTHVRGLSSLIHAHQRINNALYALPRIFSNVCNVAMCHPPSLLPIACHSLPSSLPRDF